VATDWQAPTELPDLRRAGIIALDTETNDEGLRADLGSAWPWRGGYICSISVAWRDDSGICGIYVPLRHPNSENFEREPVARWLKTPSTTASFRSSCSLPRAAKTPLPSRTTSSSTMGRVGIGTPGKHRRSLGPRAWGRARAKRRSAAFATPTIPGTAVGSGGPEPTQR
jgi:hypothetical protein